MSIIVSRLVRLCASVALLTACDSRRSDAPPRQRTNAEVAYADSIYYATPRPELSDSVKADIRRACSDLAASARSAGAKQVVVSDTILVANAYQARLGSCIVRAQKFGDGVDADLFKSGPSAKNWSWHGFEGSTGDIIYALERKNVQCEVTPLGVAATYIASDHVPTSRTSRRPARQQASGFHIFCSDG
jgi:hypothetical protein